jgi:hypothetical protein
MFQPSVHPQAVKIHKIEITIATPIMGGQIETSVFVVTKCMSINFLKQRIYLIKGKYCRCLMACGLLNPFLEGM